MANSAVILHCSQSDCQTANPDRHQFCSACNTPLIRHYLWTIGAEPESDKLGELIGDRYHLVQPRIVLDTKPALLPEFPEEPPKEILSYLRLFSQRLHIPQIYGRLLPEDTASPATWLLEYGTPLDRQQCENGQVLTPLQDLWRQSTALRQLNWLWQMAKLWQPLQEEGVASSLLSPSLLRTRDSVLKLLELRQDLEPVTLPQLAQLWLSWVTDASPLIRKFLQELCDRTIAQEITESSRLLTLLDYAIAQCGKSRQCRYQIVARTDTGKARSHNEDDCYPPDKQEFDSNKGEWPLAIVCDGIGGHDGGEVASHLAIKEISRQLSSLFAVRDKPLRPTAIAQFLENTVLNANDIIGDRNNKERRQDKRRMGTTVVMAAARNQQMFLTHVGDSRIYWLTRNSCHQVTVDDDIASREVRLGYALYRDALTFPSSGALIQALGMNASSRLYPTLDRVVLDENCLFLLCSDGLSDRDRVEQYWRSEIVPILTGEKDIATVCDRLIDLANEKNGHDNVTVALIHCQITPSATKGGNIINFPLHKEKIQKNLSSVVPEQSTIKVEEKKQKNSPHLLLWSILIFSALLGGLGVLSYSLFPEVRYQTNRLLGNTTVTTNSTPNPTSPDVSIPSPGANSLNWQRLNIGDGVIVEEAIALPTSPINSTEKTLDFVQVLPDTVLKIVSKKEGEEGEIWLKMQTCLPKGDRANSGDRAVQLPAPPEASEKPQETEKTAMQTGWLRVDIAPELAGKSINSSDLPRPCR
ncbi:PP2C family serine/threonine-protein phosphatase [Spirulina sp. 06S082]|nr:PP2C family serine/threonine-protein phosphatase [Spirulina sp. 06S082]